MEPARPLYLMLSRTVSHIGKTILPVTSFGYNHVSLSLDITKHFAKLRGRVVFGHCDPATAVLR